MQTLDDEKACLRFDSEQVFQKWLECLYTASKSDLEISEKSMAQNEQNGTSKVDMSHIENVKYKIHSVRNFVNIYSDLPIP